MGDQVLSSRLVAALSDGRLSSLEVCAGAGGLALGLESAGFDPVLLIENRTVACDTLRTNRPRWDVRELDLLDFDPIDAQQVYDVDLLSAGLPRVKAMAAINRVRGSELESELLRATILLVHGVQPRSVLLENVPDLVTSSAYREIREFIDEELTHLGYSHRWFVMNAADCGVPQDRKHGIMVAFKSRDAADRFQVPETQHVSNWTVGDVLRDSMAARGWAQVDEWADQAGCLAPTLVGGSWDRGGADLGPTRTKTAWARIGVDGGTIGDRVPGADFVWSPALGRDGMVKLTLNQAALLQGFPNDWKFAGRKTAHYRQVANAVPPAVARALGVSIATALRSESP